MKEETLEKKSYTMPLLMIGFGAAVGALLGVLFAPDKGSETRRKVKAWMKEKSEKGKETLTHKSEQVVAAISAGRKAYEEANHKKEPVMTR